MKRLLILVSFLITSSLQAEQIGFWQVQKVKKSDSLNIREKADHTSKKVSSIPYDAQCVINHGCGKDIGFQAMMHMHEEEIKAFLSQAKEAWCYVEYNGKSGWSNQYYLKANTKNCN